MEIEPDEKRFMKKLGAKVRSYRAKAGWTLEETEDHGWPSWRHLQRIEAGKNVTAVTLRRVCRLYKIPLADLFKDL